MVTAGPAPCKPPDEVHAASSALLVRLVSIVVSFAGVRGRPPRPIRHSQPRSRTAADAGERWSALLESVLGATPREFESRILRSPDQALCCGPSLIGLVTLCVWSQFWSTLSCPASADQHILRVPGRKNRIARLDRDMP